MAYDNTNTGALFKNDKEGNPNWADYKGKINVDGKDYWLSAWIKEGKSGKFMSLAVKSKDGATKSQVKRIDAQTGPTDATDDIPF